MEEILYHYRSQKKLHCNEVTGGARVANSNLNRNSNDRFTEGPNNVSFIFRAMGFGMRAKGGSLRLVGLSRPYAICKYLIPKGSKNHAGKKACGQSSVCI